MSVHFHSEAIRFDLKKKVRHKNWIRNWITNHQRIPGDLSIIFTSNEQIKLMNQEYLNHNYFTDVITFDYSLESTIAGDIFISVDQIRLNAKKYSVSIEDELRRVMIHGVLHLMGYEDTSVEEKELMRKKENEALHLWLKLV